MRLFKRILYIALSMAVLLSAIVVPVSAAPSISLSVPRRDILVGQTLQASVTTNPTGISVAWSSNNTSVATVTSYGLITGISPGTAWIIATCTDSSGATNTSYVIITVGSPTGIENGQEYYIMNQFYRRYISLETPSTAEGTNIVAGAKSTSTTHKWIMTQLTDGQYRITSAYNATTKVMGVSGTDVNLYTRSNVRKFSVYRIDSGTYCGLYAICYGNYYVAVDSSYQIYLSSTLNRYSAWSFSKTVKGSSKVFDFNYTYTENGTTYNYNSTGATNTFKSAMSSLGYTSQSTTNSTATVAGSALETADIFVFRGHGAPGFVRFYGNGNTYQGDIVADTAVHNYSADYHISECTANELAKLRCVMYLGCSTGADYTSSSKTYNLVDSTFAKGAHFVLGTTETVYVNDSNNFLIGFAECYTTDCNCTIQNAITAGIERAGTNTVYQNDLYPVYYVGDTSQRLN